MYLFIQLISATSENVAQLWVNKKQVHPYEFTAQGWDDVFAFGWGGADHKTNNTALALCRQVISQQASFWQAQHVAQTFLKGLDPEASHTFVLSSFQLGGAHDPSPYALVTYKGDTSVGETDEYFTMPLPVGSLDEATYLQRETTRKAIESVYRMCNDECKISVEFSDELNKTEVWERYGITDCDSANEYVLLPN